MIKEEPVKDAFKPKAKKLPKTLKELRNIITED